MPRLAATFATAAAGWNVYVVETKSGKLYTGITTDITRRLRQHAGYITGGAKALRGDPPVRLRYAEPAENRSAASRRESALKKLSRVEKLRLVDGVDGEEAELQQQRGRRGGGLSGLFNNEDDDGGRGGSGVVALAAEELAALDPLRANTSENDAAGGVTQQ